MDQQKNWRSIAEKYKNMSGDKSSQPIDSTDNNRIYHNNPVYKEFPSSTKNKTYRESLVSASNKQSETDLNNTDPNTEGLRKKPSYKSHLPIPLVTIVAAKNYQNSKIIQKKKFD